MVPSRWRALTIEDRAEMMAFSEVQSKINNWLMEQGEETAAQQSARENKKKPGASKKRKKWEDS